jgi:hypothetical protein
VGQKPEWATAHPRAFERPRQVVTVTAHSGRIWETGHFEDALTIVTEAGSVQIPLRLEVVKARRHFGQIAWWYLPLLFATLAPVTLATLGSGDARHSWLLPPAAAVSGFLALMLTLTCAGAETQIGPRILPGVFSGVLLTFLGAMLASPSGALFEHGRRVAAATTGVMLLLIFCQLAKMPRWKLWAFVALCVGVATCSMLWNILVH